MGVAWRVGVLRRGTENVAWERAGVAGGWAEARSYAVAVLTDLARSEGRQEYRVEVGDVVGIVNPGLDENGEVDTTDLGSALRLHRE
ncbi:hypothetical protein H7X46_02780 [Pseudonocardia sp. C8]|uniref:hypothetical protein n=1 Tax=Pseudonocardia sp. C8 TaxID=2762759 RepID=UPI0016427EC8|nr:hypothetical protein [Pseudonocardia sp. C8]MBC3189987.1 hypothetical protein [Pseudonocardia sp. C8]